METCEGCKSRHTCETLYNFDDITKCPCRICIVKMMFCTGCEEHHLFFQNEYKHKRPITAKKLKSFIKGFTK